MIRKVDAPIDPMSPEPKRARVFEVEGWMKDEGSNVCMQNVKFDGALSTGAVHWKLGKGMHFPSLDMHAIRL